jgi:hypothetical protein
MQETFVAQPRRWSCAIFTVVLAILGLRIPSVNAAQGPGYRPPPPAYLMQREEQPDPFAKLPPPEDIRLTYIQGDVRFNRSKKLSKAWDLKNRWYAATAGLRLQEGMMIYAGDDGRAEIEFQSGAKVYLAENSLLAIQEAVLNDGSPQTTVHLTAGSATLAGRYTGGENFTFVATSHTLRARRGTESFVRIDTYQDGLIFSQQDKDSAFPGDPDLNAYGMKYGTALIFNGKARWLPTVPDRFDAWVVARRSRAANVDVSSARSLDDKQVRKQLKKQWSQERFVRAADPKIQGMSIATARPTSISELRAAATPTNQPLRDGSLVKFTAHKAPPMGLQHFDGTSIPPSVDGRN